MAMPTCKKRKRKALLVVGIHAACIAFALIGLFVYCANDNVPITFDGYGVDSENRLYVATSNGERLTIEVFSEGAKQTSFSMHRGRAYAFTVSNDTLILSNGQTVFIMDLYGNILEEYEDNNTGEFNRLQRLRTRVLINKDGQTYKLLFNWGRPRIVLNDTETVYLFPAGAYACLLC